MLRLSSHHDLAAADILPLSSKEYCGFALQDVFGHLTSISKEQSGSRFLQENLRKADGEEFDRSFDELLPQSSSLAFHVFGNYVIQAGHLEVAKCFLFQPRTKLSGQCYCLQILLERASKVQMDALIERTITSRVLALTVHIYGCRTLQRAMKFLTCSQLLKLSQELTGNIVRVSRDLNGNHVIQKLIQYLPKEEIELMLDPITQEVYLLITSKHRFNAAYYCQIPIAVLYPDCIPPS